MPNHHQQTVPPRLAVSISGSGGTGAVTVGLILLDAVAKAGFYGNMTRAFGPQIRGGESAVMLHFSDQPIETLAEFSQLHLALDWVKFDRFEDEIPLTSDSLVIYENSREKPPGLVENSGATLLGVDLQAIVKTIKGSRINMVALGIVAQQIGLARHFIEAALQKTLGRKGSEVVETSMAAVDAGMALLTDTPLSGLANWQPTHQPRWNMSGNEACGLGTLRGGLKFAAAYPITPATDIVEYLARPLVQMGGNLLIAEDELAAMNMVIGASFGGAPSMTATSGPGLSLMIEAMGLAVAAEIPALVITVMRGGPSTGIPTKSEQSDLNQALYALHGDAPHLVIAPLNIQESVNISQWALALSEALQTLVILVTDQHLGQTRMIMDPVDKLPLTLSRLQPKADPTADTAVHYQRYQITDSGISPMSLPGMGSYQYAAEGLTHTESGLPSSRVQDHAQHLHKRSHKILQFDYGELWAQRLPMANAQHTVITWGSSFEAVKEAVKLLNHRGAAISLIGLRLIMPLQAEALAALTQHQKVLVIEQNDSAQLSHYLLAEKAIPLDSEAYAKPGPLLFKPSDLIRPIQTWMEDRT